MDKSWIKFSSAERVIFFKNNTADCTFLVCLEGEEEPMKFNSFKLILSSVSPVFERMFNGDFKEAKSSDPIKITDIYACDFDDFLRFVHGQESCVTNWTSVYNVAKKYMADEIVKRIIKKLVHRSKTPKEALQLFEISSSEEMIFKLHHYTFSTNNNPLLKYSTNNNPLLKLLTNRNPLLEAVQNQCPYILHLSPEVFLKLLSVVQSYSSSHGKCFRAMTYYCSFATHFSTLEKENFVKMSLQEFDCSKLSIRDFLDYVEGCEVFDINTKYEIILDIIRESN